MHHYSILQIVFFMVEKLIMIIFGQAVLGIGALIKLYFSNERLKERVREMEERHKDFQAEFKELRDLLMSTKNNTDLLLLGRIKTGEK